MSTTRPLRWGLWGTGRISHHVAQDLHLVQGASVAVVGGRRLEAARALAARHRGAQAVDSLDALLAHVGVDAVYVATPDGLHRADATAVLAAGKPLVCEKPLGASLADVQVTVAAAQRRNVFLMEAMWMRFLPAIRALKADIDAGRIGRVRFMRGSFAYADPRRGHEPYGSLAESMLYDRGVYLLALAQMLVGTHVEQVQARFHDGAGRGGCEFDVRFAGGAWLSGWCGNAGMSSNGFEIVGERGSITLDGPFFKPHTYTLHLHGEAVQAGPSSIGGGDAKASRWIATAKAAKRRMQPLLDGVRHAVEGSRHNFPGNGYQFQFDAVARALAANAVQCEGMRWDDSLALARLLQAVRDAAA